MEEVSIVPGGKPTMYFTMTALLEPGDEVIYPNPSFPIYESMINFLGAKAVPIPLSDKNGFAFDLNRFKDSLTPKTKMVILNSPANPTGGIQSEQEVRELAKMLADRDVMVLSDEIYSRIVYWSTPWSISGWRLGFGVMPVWLQDAVFKVAVNATSCTATMNQYAALAAIEGPQDCVDEMVAKFKERRDAIVKGLNEIPGFRCTLPDGAFYAFPNVEGTGIPSKDLADMLLNEAGVACLDGAAFGQYGSGYIRFSYANSLENIMEAVSRIKKFSAKWAK